MPKYVVRCGVMRMLGVFTPSRNETLRRGTRVIARTERGLECGEVLCDATDEAVEKIQDPRRGQIVRAMTVEDERELTRLQEQQRSEFTKCEDCIQQLALPMQLVDVEHIFGGERIVVYYLAENRIDFRELVKLLAAEFQTRIEMRQIGVRDEAKLLADYGDCGKPVCCNRSSGSFEGNVWGPDAFTQTHDPEGRELDRLAPEDANRLPSAPLLLPVPPVQIRFTAAGTSDNADACRAACR